MRTLIAVTLATTATLLVSTATAAPTAQLPESQLIYQKERAACMLGESGQDQATCLREAGAALQEARRGSLLTGNEREFEQNKLIRCASLPPADREDCGRRMRGEGTTSGSVQRGGIFRELTRELPPGSNEGIR